MVKILKGYRIVLGYLYILVNKILKLLGWLKELMLKDVEL